MMQNIVPTLWKSREFTIVWKVREKSRYLEIIIKTLGNFALLEIYICASNLLCRCTMQQSLKCTKFHEKTWRESTKPPVQNRCKCCILMLKHEKYCVSIGVGIEEEEPTKKFCYAETSIVNYNHLEKSFESKGRLRDSRRIS